MHVSNSVQAAASKIVGQLDSQGYAVIDGFLGEEVADVYRREAEGCYARGEMVTSQSTRWDEITSAHVAYDKKNVHSMQLSGGRAYRGSPRLHEYVVGMIEVIFSYSHQRQYHLIYTFISSVQEFGSYY